MKALTGLWTTVLVLAFLAAPAMAEGPLESSMEVFLVQQEEDGETLARVGEVEPDDVLEYLLVYKNVSDRPLAGITVNGPVPASTDYVAGSATTEIPADFVVSYDRGNSYHAEPVYREVTTADGRTEKKPVDPSEYTNLRWNANASMEGGETWEFRYRVKVE